MITIWHDGDFDFAQWVFENSNLAETTEEVYLRPIPKNNKPETLLGELDTKSDFRILPFIRYETPDIIIQRSGSASSGNVLLVSEFMTHTPQWQHPAQRFARIYGASELGVPAGLVLPQEKVKLEKGSDKVYTESTYTCSPSVYALFNDANDFSQEPVLLFHWPHKKGYLKSDPEHPTAPMDLGDVKKWLELLNGIMGENIPQNIVKERRNFLKENKNEPKIGSYGTIEGIVKTQDLIEEENLEVEKLSDNFRKRERSLIFSPSGLSPPSSYFRTDPYAGMLCAYDYLFCRDKSTKDRKINLVFRANNVKFSELTKSTFSKIDHNEDKCPFISIENNRSLPKDDIEKHLNSGECPYTKSKKQRIYGEVSDIILFEDLIYYG